MKLLYTTCSLLSVLLLVSFADAKYKCYDCLYSATANKFSNSEDICKSEDLAGVGQTKTPRNYCFTVLGYKDEVLSYVQRGGIDKPEQKMKEYIVDEVNSDVLNSKTAIDQKLVYVVRFCEDDMCNSSSCLKAVSIFVLLPLLFKKLF